MESRFVVVALAVLAAVTLAQGPGPDPAVPPPTVEIIDVEAEDDGGIIVGMIVSSFDVAKHEFVLLGANGVSRLEITPEKGEPISVPCHGGHADTLNDTGSNEKTLEFQVDEMPEKIKSYRIVLMVDESGSGFGEPTTHQVPDESGGAGPVLAPPARNTGGLTLRKVQVLTPTSLRVRFGFVGGPGKDLARQGANGRAFLIFFASETDLIKWLEGQAVTPAHLQPVRLRLSDGKVARRFKVKVPGGSVSAGQHVAFVTHLDTSGNCVGSQAHCTTMVQ